MAIAVIGTSNPPPPNDKNAVAHSNPVWRARADSLLHVSIEPGSDKLWEQLWARAIPGTGFELCCIPFMAYGLALGDLVETGDGPGDRYIVERVVLRSNLRTFRAWFGAAPDPDRARVELTAELAAAGYLYEFYSRRLMAIAALIAKSAALVELLKDWEDRGLLEYEDGGAAS